MSTSQKYILGGNDEIKPSLVTSVNKNNLITGGLFQGLTLTDVQARASGDFDSRKLKNSNLAVTLDWENLRAVGDWSIDGELEVSQDVNITGALDVSADVTASNFHGNFIGSFVGDFDLSSVGASDAADLVLSANIDTDDVPEGLQNGYYTESKFKESINTTFDVQSPITAAWDAGTYKIELGSIHGLVNTGKSVHVNNTSGTDDRGLLSPYDFTQPFASIIEAKAAAISGDTIIVWPGLYEDEYDILKAGVDYFFLPGTTVVQTSSYANSVPLFRDAGAITSNVFGYGKFITSSNTQKGLISVANASSKIRIEASLLQSTTADSGSAVVTHSAGALELCSRKILSTGLGVRTSSDTLIVKDSYIIADQGPALETKGISVTCLVDGCQLKSTLNTTSASAVFIEPNSSGLRLKNCILHTLGDYSVVTTTSDSCVVSILSGVTANKNLGPGVTAETLAPFTVDNTFNTTIF